MELRVTPCEIKRNNYDQRNQKQQPAEYPPLCRPLARRTRKANRQVVRTIQDHGLWLSGSLANPTDVLQPLLPAKQAVHRTKHHRTMGTTHRKRYRGINPKCVEAKQHRGQGKLVATRESNGLRKAQPIADGHDGYGKRHPVRTSRYRSHRPRL